MKRLSLEAKTAIVRKALNTKGKSRKEIAEENNIGFSTLQKWIGEFRESGALITKGSVNPKAQLTREAQFNHILATSKLDEKAVSTYCRAHGLYGFQLAEWKKEFMRNEHTPKKSKESSEFKALKTENKRLKRELNRKDKALAETSALLVLKKKANLIWGDDEDV